MNEKLLIVIPVYALDRDRRRALDFVLAAILKAGLPVLIAEQASGSCLTDLPDRVGRVVIPCLGDLFAKAWLMNHVAMRFPQVEHLWFHDAEVWLPFKTVASRIRHQEVIRPFGHVTFLDEGQTRRFIDGHPVDIPQQTRRMSLTGGGSTIVRRDVYMNLRGYNEAFVGYGYEDTEFYWRVAMWANETVFENVTGVHLWHEKVRPRYAENQELKAASEAEMRHHPGRYLLEMESQCPPTGFLDGIDDTMVIMCGYGPPREDRIEGVFATSSVLEWQHPLPNVLMLELVCGDDGPLYRDVGDTQHAWAFVHGTDRNRDLFQKEALWNIAARSCTSKYLIFLDADCHPAVTDPGWAWRVRGKLREDETSVVQGFSALVDPRDPSPPGSGGPSWTWELAHGKPHATRKTGVCWAMTRETFEDIGGWNPFGITGAGDALFCTEVTMQAALTTATACADYFRRLVRPGITKRQAAYVNATLTHEYHGSLAERAYVTRHAALDQFGDIRDHVVLDEQGLLAWRDPGCALRRVVRRKPEMLTRADALRIVDEERARG